MYFQVKVKCPQAPSAMASKSTHVYKTVGDLNLRVDVYTRKSHEETNAFDPKQPVALFLHGGGWVAFDREHIPPHVIQSSLLRGWPLISADYRVLPQVKGADIFEDVKDAYSFVEEKVPGILAGKETEDTIENIILVGQSTGNAPRGSIDFLQMFSKLNFY